MKKWRIEYRPCFTATPMSFWVHKHLDHEVWLYASEFEPPLPKPIPCKGYPFLIVSVPGTELMFASVEEVEHFLEVMRQKNLPTTYQLSLQRIDNHGPNSHWLSRLPAALKPWSKRVRMMPVVEKALVAFRREWG